MPARVKRLFVALIVSSLFAFVLAQLPSPLTQPGRAAAAANVEINGFVFSPLSLTVAAGTTVTWTNNSFTPHTVTSDTGIFDSGDMLQGAVFSFTFTTPGTYGYFCEYHGGMRGTIVVEGAAPQPTATATAVPAPSAPAPPTLDSPANGSTLANFGPTVSWSNPAGTTQVQLQLIPASNDGPGVNLHLGSPETSFSIPAPPDWYGLLPGMGYTWQVRASNNELFVPDDDSSWSEWATATFRTPAVNSAAIGAVSPPNGATGVGQMPTLQWSNSRSDIFYYEVQVSKDPEFGPNAFLYWELRHGGATAPPNSYSIPQSFPLERNTSYFWRVRPRVQGDGTPVGWSTVFKFSTAAGTTPATAGRIAFQSERTSGGVDIFMALADGSESRAIWANSPSYLFTGDGEWCSWAPDNSRLLIDGGTGEIYILNVNGGEALELTKDVLNGAESPQWSPDGAKVVFGADDIFTMSSDGSGLLRLTSGNNGNPAVGLRTSPQWSPDGSRIAFVSTRDGSEKVYVVNASGNGLMRLSDGSAKATRPLWSPDGRKIAYYSTESSTSALHVVNADGGGSVNLTGTLRLSEEQLPSWSPDSNLLAFRVVQSSFRDDIYVVRADASGLTNLTNSVAREGYPVWFPDGTRIAYVTSGSGGVGIWLMNSDGSNKRKLADTGNIFSYAYRISSDGHRLAFTSNLDGNYEVHVINADGTGLKNLSNHPGIDRNPVWSAN